MRKQEHANAFVSCAARFAHAGVVALFALCATPSLAFVGSSFTICNQSERTTLRVALVELNSMSAVIGAGHPWRGMGWAKAAPGRCRTVFEDAPWQSSFWLRIEADNQPLRTTWRNRFITPVEDRFCLNPRKAFTWQRGKQSEAEKDCNPGEHPGLFNFFVKFHEPTEARIGINPDEMERYPAEAFVLKPPGRTLRHEVTDLSEDLAGAERRPAFLAVIRRANQMDGRILKCIYPNRQVTFWYDVPPPNLSDFLRLDREIGAADRGVLPTLGIDALKMCPADADAAERLQASNKAKWMQALSQRRPQAR